MKKIIAFVISFLLLVALSVTAFAETLPYENYTYSEKDGSVILNPDAYVPATVIYGTDWPTKPLLAPSDMDTDKNGEFYILDAGNARVVVLDEKLSYKAEFSLNRTDASGEEIKPNAPKGITVFEDSFYICDTAGGRILIYSKTDGELIGKIDAPTSRLLGEDFMFQPTKVAVDSKGNLYVVSNGTFEGIINMDPEGEFKGFFGTNKVTSSAWDIFWRKFSSVKQRKTMEQLIPQDFSSIDLDADGFFLITTYTVQNDSMVKKVNQGGVNILRSKSNVAIAGDPAKVMKGTLSGNSSFIDISSGPHKIYACLDRTRGRVFCYNNEGYLLYSFGTLAAQTGGFKTPVAVSYLSGSDIAVLDGENSSVTVFTATEYGETINLGVEDYNDLEYEAAAEHWEKVLTLNRNYQLAADMMGRYYFSGGDYKTAMTYFERTDNREMYSEAKEALRTAWVYENSWIIVMTVVLVLLLFASGPVMQIVRKYKANKR